MRVEGSAGRLTGLLSGTVFDALEVGETINGHAMLSRMLRELESYLGGVFVVLDEC